MTTVDLLEIIIQASLGASIAILLILLIRSSLRKMFGSRVAYRIWALVPVAMIASILPAEYVVVPSEGYIAEMAVPMRGSNISYPSVNSLVSPDNPIQPETTISIAEDTLVILWLIGFLASIGIVILRQHLFLSRQKFLNSQSKILRPESSSYGPAVTGVFRPRIILPRNFNITYNKLERTLILAHEKAHIRNGDLRVNFFVEIIRCLSWFNPIVHYAQAVFRVDQELACDERVMITHSKHRHIYAEALLKSQLTAQAVPMGCNWVPKTICPLKSRIENLNQPMVSARRSLAGFMVTVAAIGFTSVSAWAMLSTQTVYIGDGSSSIDEQASDNEGEARDTKGYALAHAISEGRRGYARKLVRDGADVNYFLRGDGTPLILSARSGDTGLVNMLLEAGADPNKLARGDGSPLIAASRRGQQAIVKLLLEAGADANGFVRGDETPLIGAAVNGNLDITRVLIEAGADVNLKVETGNHGIGRSKYRSPLGQAILYGNDRIADLLRRRGATEPTAKED